MADYLPEIIIINILHRLPAKALLRCTSVCKLWYSLITSSQFISSHLNFTQHAGVVLLRRCVRNSERYDLYSDGDSLTRLRRWEFPFTSINSCFTIVGSCNGLVCLSDDRVYLVNTIILWNPCVRRSIVLPKPRLVYNSFGTFTQCLGFGFDSVNSDYKVVRVTYLDSNGEYPQVELYRVNTGVWEDMSDLKLEYAIYNRSRQAFVHGCVHWVASSMDGYDLIVLFDMQRELFQEMMLPGGLVGKDLTRTKDLIVFRESIGVVLWNVGECGFCVWAMNEYGVMESWMKHLRFDFREFGGGSVRPLWVRRSGSIVAVWEDGSLICCSRDGADVENLGVKGLSSEEYKRMVHADGYVESLVLLNSGSCCYDAVSGNALLGSDGEENVDIGY